jgi:hypothetical protein
VFFLSLRVQPSRSRGVPGESLDAPENLPKEGPRQVAFGHLQDEVPGMPNEAPAGLEEPSLETRQRPAPDGEGPDQPTQEIAEVVGDNPEEQAGLIGPEPVTSLRAGTCPTLRTSPQTARHPSAMALSLHDGRRLPSETALTVWAANTLLSASTSPVASRFVKRWAPIP